MRRSDLTFPDKVSDVVLVATFHDQGDDADDPAGDGGNPYSVTMMMCAILCHPYMTATKVTIIMIPRKLDSRGSKPVGVVGRLIRLSRDFLRGMTER